MKITKENLEKRPSLWFWDIGDTTVYMIDEGIVWLLTDGGEWLKSSWTLNDENLLSSWATSREFIEWL